MQVSDAHKELTVESLTDSWIANTIRPNPEYQRGSAWKQRQKQLLVDSVLRGYPLPRFYFQQRVNADVFGTPVTTLEVIDGQQRLIALSEFRQDMWPLFTVDDEKVPLPPSIRQTQVAWSGRTFSTLPESVQQTFLGVTLSVVIIDEVTGDEVRDLFIRLQSGTPLTAQQVRDAWPGSVGPFIERLAGKGRRTGSFHSLFASVDRRGQGGVADDEYEDSALDARQTCAQLLLLLLAKERGRGYPSLRSAALNDLYHENTDFDVRGKSAALFERLLEDTQKVVLLRPPGGGRRKLRKSQLFSLFVFMRFLRFGPYDVRRVIEPLAEVFWSDESGTEPTGRAGSPETLERHSPGLPLSSFVTCGSRNSMAIACSPRARNGTSTRSTAADAAFATSRSST